MKTILFFALTFISANAFATRMMGDYPKIQFGNIFVSALEVCVTGSNVKTVHAVPICEEWERGESPVCIKAIKKHLSTSINYSKLIPLGEGNFGTIPMTIPLNYRVAFGYMTESGIMPVYFQDFSIPACEQ